jgi:hypothetical protein
MILVPGNGGASYDGKRIIPYNKRFNLFLILEIVSLRKLILCMLNAMTG